MAALDVNANPRNGGGRSTADVAGPSTCSVKTISNSAGVTRSAAMTVAATHDLEAERRDVAGRVCRLLDGEEPSPSVCRTATGDGGAGIRDGCQDVFGSATEERRPSVSALSSVARANPLKQKLKNTATQTLYDGEEERKINAFVMTDNEVMFALEADLKKSYRTIDSLRCEMDTLRSTFTELRAENKCFGSSIERLQRERATQDQILDEIKYEIKAKDTESDCTQGDMNALKRSIADLEDKLQSKDAALGGMQRDLDVKDKLVERLSEDLRMKDRVIALHDRTLARARMELFETGVRCAEQQDAAGMEQFRKSQGKRSGTALKAMHFRAMEAEEVAKAAQQTTEDAKQMASEATARLYHSERLLNEKIGELSAELEEKDDDVEQTRVHLLTRAQKAEQWKRELLELLSGLRFVAPLSDPVKLTAQVNALEAASIERERLRKEDKAAAAAATTAPVVNGVECTFVPSPLESVSSDGLNGVLLPLGEYDFGENYPVSRDYVTCNSEPVNESDRDVIVRRD